MKTNNHNQCAVASSIALALFLYGANVETKALTLISAQTRGNPNGVTVLFSAAVNPATATNPANYTIDHGVTVHEAALMDISMVGLRTSFITENQGYLLTINGVQAASGGVLSSNIQCPFLQTQGVLTRREFYNLPGSSLSDLTNCLRFPNAPDVIGYNDSFEISCNVRENYGVQLVGYLTPPVTGDYRFFIASDDQGALFLSADDNPANKALIANESSWGPPRFWHSAASNEGQVSHGIHLEGGRKYYVEALMKQAAGGDHLSVAWQMPDQQPPTNGLSVIPGVYLSSLESNAPVTITSASTSQTVDEGAAATFTVTATGTPPIHYQWVINGVPSIGATNSIFTLNSVSTALDGISIEVWVANEFSAAMNSSAVLHVTPDIGPPSILTASGGLTWVHVTFSEPLDPVAATTVANYSLDGGASVVAAHLERDACTVTLTTTRQTDRQVYHLSVSGVKDLAASANSILAGAQANYTAMPGSITLNVDAMTAPTNCPADSFLPDWSNPPVQVRLVPDWFPVWAKEPIKLLYAPGPESADHFLLRSRYACRDFETDFLLDAGRLYLRLTPEGKALMVECNFYSSDDAYVAIYYVSGVRDDLTSQESKYPLASLRGTNFNALVPEFQWPLVPSGLFTVGAEGFDVYLKYNGREFYRFRDYRHVVEGNVALRAPDGYGFRNVAIRCRETPKPLFSDYQNRVLDLRDFGLKSIMTTGSISAGGNTLSLSSAPAPGFQPGDYVIVELGGEPGQGHRGTMGVGGTWPALHYPNDTALNNDTTQPVGTFAWVENSGEVRQWNGTQWFDFARWTNSVGTRYYDYYYAKAIPKALRARVNEVSPDGRTLTLSHTAAVSSVGARVYYDNFSIINSLGSAPDWFSAADLTPTNITLQLPEGEYALGEQLRIERHPSWTFRGMGATQTKLFSPRGVASAGLTFQNSPNAAAQDFHMLGNGRNEGFGLLDQTFSYPQETVSVDYMGRPRLANGITFSSDSSEGRCQRLRVTDTIPPSLQSCSKNVWFEDCDVVASEGVRTYLGAWSYQFAGASGGGARRCTFYSPEVVPAWESMLSFGTTFEECRSTNGKMAFNTSGGFLVRNMDFRFTPNSYPTNWDVQSTVVAIDITKNTPSDDFVYYGGTVENSTISQEGLLNSERPTVVGISASGPVYNLVIRNVRYHGPDYQGVANDPGPVAFSGWNPTTIIEKLEVSGRPNPQYGNVELFGGTIIGSHADMIRAHVGREQIIDCWPNSNLKPRIATLYTNAAELLTQSLDIGTPGNPSVPGALTHNPDGSFDIFAGGRMGWEDHLYFAFFQADGDFELTTELPESPGCSVGCQRPIKRRARMRWWCELQMMDLPA